MKNIRFKTDISPTRVATHPQNDKIQDSLLTKIEWSEEDCELLISCLRNYES